MTPRILDLFCKAGGMARGYADAGFEVVGVDIEAQPNYPFEFRQANALTLPFSFLTGFDAIHASPPCQFATAYKRRPGVAEDAVNLIPDTRKLLEATGLPFIIENVEQAELHLHDPIRLCGGAFGLDVQRHRLFETNWPCVGVPCNHGWQTPRFPQATNRKNKRSTVEVGAWRCADIAPAAMGIDWMTNAELAEAIPPRYAQFIGWQLHAYLRANAESRIAGGTTEDGAQ